MPQVLVADQPTWLRAERAVLKALNWTPGVRADFSILQTIKKADAQQIVYGWASMSIEDGEQVTDLQGDQIDPDELDAAVTQYMLDYYQHAAGGAGVMHETEPQCLVIASLVTTAELMTALFPQIGDEALAKIPIGWILGLKVLDADTWARVQSGELRALSIQGSAERVPA